MNEFYISVVDYKEKRHLYLPPLSGFANDDTFVKVYMC